MGGRFLYGVVRSDKEIELEPGVEEEDVFLVSSDGLSAAVHKCPPEPYDTTEKEKVEKWMAQYISILDSLTERFDTVVPFRFDTILKDGTEGVRSFLKENRSELMSGVENVKGRQEYVVSIEFEKEFEGGEEEVKKGKDYLLQKKAQKEKKESYEKEKKELRKKIFERIEAASYKVKEEDRKGMLLRLSLLLSEKETTKVSDILEEFHSQKDISVDFSGPWPPFSFTEVEI